LSSKLVKLKDLFLDHFMNHLKMPSCTLRIARPTNDLSALVKFYTTALGLAVISSFEDHASFDGVMLGHPDCSWHLEFTHRHGETVERAPSKEHLLVFYVKEKEEWERAVKKVEDAGGVKVESENPYWDVYGATFEDPDGYRVVLQNAGWR
jgi:predicted lactoylglutathione lyase